jgi:hypothetical protein
MASVSAKGEMRKTGNLVILFILMFISSELAL